MYKRAGLFFVLFFVLLDFSPGNCEIVQWDYDGVVIRKGSLPAFSIGDKFHMSISFESDALDSFSDDPTFGTYFAMKEISFTVGSYQGFIDDSGWTGIQIANDYADQAGRVQDYFIFRTSSGLHGPAIDDWNLDYFEMQLVDFSHTAFTSDALPIAKLDPANFDGDNWNVMVIGFLGQTGEIENVVAYFAPVPLPGALLLLGSGLVALAGLRKRLYKA